MTTDPFKGARTPEVTIVVAGVEYLAKEYSLDDDVLQLGDPFACTIANIDGENTGKIHLGDPLEVYMADPAVRGGAKLRQMKGRVIGLETSSDISGGSTITVKGADLGWHLTHTAGEPWMNLRGIRFSRLLEAVLDPAWGIAGVRAENDTNRRLRLGRAGVQQAYKPQLGAVLPRIQIEPGEMIADLLLLYAKRERVLVNVSSDGYLQFWNPRYDTDAACSIRYHRSTEKERDRNNVLGRPRLSESIDGLYTDVGCVWTSVIPPEVRNSENPNEGFHIVWYRAPGALPFPRRLVFSDGEAMSTQMAEDRARWKYERGLFDSWQYEVTLVGHSQGGAFFAADTMAEVDDTVNGVRGKFYVSAVTRSRTLRDGTTTRLVLRKSGLLRA